MVENEFEKVGTKHGLSIVACKSYEDAANAYGISYKRHKDDLNTTRNKIKQITLSSNGLESLET